MSNTKLLLQDLIRKNGVETALEIAFSSALNSAQSTFMLTGSASYLSNVSRFINGSSDIDTLLIMKDQSAINDIQSIFNGDIKRNDIDYDIININYRYGSGRNTLHVKCMNIDVYRQIVNFSKLNLRSYRKTSLVKNKPYANFYTTSSVTPVYRHYYIESPLDDNSGYILTYSLNPILPDGKSYIMSDLHTMVMTGRLIADGANIAKSHYQYKLAISKLLLHIEPHDRANTLQYFFDKHDLTRADIQCIIDQPL